MPRLDQGGQRRRDALPVTRQHVLLPERLYRSFKPEPILDCLYYWCGLIRLAGRKPSCRVCAHQQSAVRFRERLPYLLYNVSMPATARRAERQRGIPEPFVRPLQPAQLPESLAIRWSPSRYSRIPECSQSYNNGGTIRAEHIPVQLLSLSDPRHSALPKLIPLSSARSRNCSCRARAST